MALLTVFEYAEKIGVPVDTVRRRIHRGRVETAVKMGRDWFIEDTEPAFVDQRKLTDKIEIEVVHE